MLTVPGSTKNRKEIIRQYVKKWLEVGFTAAPCSEQSPRPLC